MASANGNSEQRMTRSEINSGKRTDIQNRQNIDQTEQKNEPVKLKDIFQQDIISNSAQMPQRPSPKRKPIPQVLSSSKAEEGHTPSNIKTADSDVEYRSNRPLRIPMTQPMDNRPFSQTAQVDTKEQHGNRHSLSATSGHDAVSKDGEQDQEHKPLTKDKYIDSSIWHKILHVNKFETKFKQNANRIDSTEKGVRNKVLPIGLQNSVQMAETMKIKAVEEGVGALHITEKRPEATAEVVDEKVELRVKKRVDSVGTDYLKEIERQYEIIEQGMLANLHLNPADEDPMFAAIIPRPDVFGADGSGDNSDPVFQRGEPVRSSAGGAIGAAIKPRLRPRTHSDNAGPLGPSAATPTRTGIGRTPVRRHSKSPTASPGTRRVPLTDNIQKFIKNSVSQEV
ncbi:hypothetical protein C0J52_11899 [Blattella germanica]|nr:hypothetical protein C0J52_11899 [Blattella germanica]